MIIILLAILLFSVYDKKDIAKDMYYEDLETTGYTHLKINPYIKSIKIGSHNTCDEKDNSCDDGDMLITSIEFLNENAKKTYADLEIDFGKTTLEDVLFDIEKLSGEYTDVNSYGYSAHKENEIFSKAKFGYEYRAAEEEVIENDPAEVITSTINKINLNDNIWIVITPILPASTGYVISENDDLSSFDDYIFEYSFDDITDYPNKYAIGDDYSDEFRKLYDALTPDKNKQNEIASKLDSLAKQLPINITGFEHYVFLNEAIFTYDYESFQLYHYENYGDFGSELNEKLKQDNAEFMNNLNEIFKEEVLMRTNGEQFSYVELLNEELCNRFNLTCDRW